MILWSQPAWRVGSPPSLETGLNDAPYPYNCRTLRIPRRNLVVAWCVESLPDKAQVELKSRLTGPRVNLLGCILALGYTSSLIPILEDTRRIH